MNPPTHVPLEPRDQPFWDSLVAEVPYGQTEFSEHQLELLASLARTLSHLEEAQRKCREEGFIVRTDRGRPIANPMASVVRALTSEVLSFRRALAIHPAAQPSGNQKNGRRRTLALDAERQGQAVDDLIARAA